MQTCVRCPTIDAKEISRLSSRNHLQASRRFPGNSFPSKNKNENYNETSHIFLSEQECLIVDKQALLLLAACD